MVVNFDGNPTQADIEEVANQLGINKSSGSSPAQNTPVPVPQKSGLEKTSKVLDDIFGGGKIGEWIGTKIAEHSKAGKDLKALELAGKVPAGTFDSTFSKPTGRELAGDALKVGTTIASAFVPVLKGSAVASKLPALGKASSVVAGLGNIGIGTGIGGTFGLAEGLRENKSGSDLAKMAQQGATFGGITTGVIGSVPALMKGAKYIASGKAPTLTETLGKVIQPIGKNTDIADSLIKGEKGFAEYFKNRAGSIPSTYSELSTDIGNMSRSLSKEKKTYLSQFEDLFKPKDLSSVSSAGRGTLTKNNYVSMAIDELKSLYSKNADIQKLSTLKKLESAYKSKGLTVSQLDDLAVQFGKEQSAFSNSGDLTHSKVRYENIRKGIKEIYRSKLPDETAKTLDSRSSSLIGLNSELDRMVAQIQKVSNKLENDTLVKKFGRGVGYVLNKTSIKPFLIEAIGQGSAIQKTDWIGIERNLSKNLKIIDKALKTKDPLQSLTSKSNGNEFIQKLVRFLNPVGGDEE